MTQHKKNGDLCPMCGQGTTRTIRIDYKIKDERGLEFVVPDLEVKECDFCGELIFNMAALRKARQQMGATEKLSIRLKPDLHATLLSRAKRSKRSLNEEVQHLIEESLREEK